MSQRAFVVCHSKEELNSIMSLWGILKNFKRGNNMISSEDRKEENALSATL